MQHCTIYVQCYGASFHETETQTRKENEMRKVAPLVLAIAILFALVARGRVVTSEDLGSGRDLLAVCTSEDQAKRSLCVGYVLGTLDAKEPKARDAQRSFSLLTNALPAATTVCELNIHGGTHTAAAGEGFQQTTLSATAPVFTFNGTPTAAQEHKAYRIPFASVNPLILVRATVNGKPATLLLDTGAPLSMISAGSDGEPVQTEVDLQFVDLEFAEHRLPKRQIIAMDLSDVSRRAGTRVDGVLGQDFLSQFSSVRINYKVQWVELEE